jgi:hypothetical protein
MSISPRNVLPAPTKEQIHAAALFRVRSAMRHIENAQNEFAAACSELSAITHGIPVWNACYKLTDKVHAFWYRVQSFSHTKRYSLDSVNIEALAKRLAEARGQE